MRKLTSSIRDGIRNLQTTAVESCRAATSIRRGPVLWLILCGGFLIAAIMIGTVLMIGEFREQALSNSERELENTVLLLARHFDQQFEDSDITTNDLISKMRFSEIASPEAFKSQMSSPDAHLMLKSKTSALSYIGDVNIFDSDGKLVNSSGDGPLPAGSIADRAYFKAFKSNPELTGFFWVCWGGGSIPPISKNSSHPSPLEKTRRFPCFIAMERCWHATLMSNR